MIDNFSELLQFSAYGGELILEDVKGTSGGGLVLENAVKTTDGIDRDMYAYVPKTGCPHDKLTQVFMVLRNCACRESAEETMHTYKLDELAEKYHKTPVQVLLRWHVQIGNSVLPGSKNPVHIKENIDIFDFCLTEEDMKKIALLDSGTLYKEFTDAMRQRYLAWEPDWDDQE